MTCFEAVIPLTSLRPYEARDYQATYPLPPPATVFGMCLSFIGVAGEEVTGFDRTRMGVSGRATSPVSTVLRKMRRDPANPPKGRPNWPSFRPEYQELLVDLTIWFVVARGHAERDLADELLRGLERPSSIDRFGGVSLGESAFLVDSLRVVESPGSDGWVLRPSRSGSLSMPVWVDFGDRLGTRVRKFERVPGVVEESDLVEVGPGADLTDGQ